MTKPAFITGIVVASPILTLGGGGQAPRDYPGCAKFLIEHEIDSISLTPDAVLRTIGIMATAERGAVPVHVGASA